MLAEGRATVLLAAVALIFTSRADAREQAREMRAVEKHKLENERRAIELLKERRKIEFAMDDAYKKYCAAMARALPIGEREKNRSDSGLKLANRLRSNINSKPIFGGWISFAWSCLWGNYQDHRESLDELRQLGQSFVALYDDRAKELCQNYLQRVGYARLLNVTLQNAPMDAVNVELSALPNELTWNLVLHTNQEHTDVYCQIYEHIMKTDDSLVNTWYSQADVEWLKQEIRKSGVVFK